MSGPHLTPGDPLGGAGARPAPAPAAEPPPRGFDYGDERPPGAGRLGPAPPAATVPAAALGPELVLAGWWRRVGAQAIDAILIGVVALLIAVPLGIGAFSADTDTGFFAVILGLVVLMLVYALVALVYAPLMMAGTNGKTVGRMATGIRVVRTNGRPMDFATAAIREVLLKAVAIGGFANAVTLGLAGLLDVLWPLWDEENRALHDFPVGTRTVLD